MSTSADIGDGASAERGAAVSAPSAQGSRNVKAALVVGVMTALVGVIGFAAWTVVKGRSAPATAKSTQIKASQVYEEPRANTFVPVAPPVQIAPKPEPVRHEAPREERVDEAMLAQQRAPLLAFSASFPRGEAKEEVDLPARDTDDRGGLERRMTPSAFPGARAGHIGDRRFIVAQGTSIPCVLETAMQSDQPGFVSCVITRDVMSDNGQVVLMERGTQVVGQYRGGLTQGQARLHVVWGRAKTPAGVVVELASAATDGLGRAGVGGYVDNHWAERFGSAILLSVIGDASGLASSAVQKQLNLQQQVSSIGDGGKQAAAIAVEQSSQIKPTLHKNQGEVVAIFVARDLDFSGVYRLKSVRDTGAWSSLPAEPSAGWPHSGEQHQPRRNGGVK